MRVHVRHGQREIRSDTLFAVLTSWNVLFSCAVCIPVLWINFIRKTQLAGAPLGEVERIWYGAVLLLWSACELPRLYLGVTGNRDHLVAPLLMFALLTVLVHTVVMFVFNVSTPRGDALDKGLTSVQLLFAFCELALCWPLGQRMVHQNTVDFYACLWSAPDARGAAAIAAGQPGKGPVATLQPYLAGSRVAARRSAGGGADAGDDSSDSELDSIAGDLAAATAAAASTTGARIGVQPYTPVRGSQEFVREQPPPAALNQFSSAAPLAMMMMATPPSVVESPRDTPAPPPTLTASGVRASDRAAATVGVVTPSAGRRATSMVPLAPPLVAARADGDGDGDAAGDAGTDARRRDKRSTKRDKRSRRTASAEP
jgi:hypothetical protein